MPQLRILHCIRQGQIGGGESHLLDLATNLKKDKFKSFVLSFTDGPMVERLSSLGVTTIVIKATRPFDVRVWSRVLSVIEDNKIQLIHIHGTRAFSNVIYSALRKDIPIVYTVHGWSFNAHQTWIKRNIAILIERYFTRVAKKVINVSYSNQRIGSKYIKGLNSNVIQNGIDLQKFNPSNRYPDVRQNLGISDDQFLIVFIARMTLQKDPCTLIRAYSQLNDKIKEKTTVLFVGDGELKHEAIQLSQELGVSTKTIFTGFRSDIPTLLHACDVYCLPSLWEGLPLGLLEAMAMRKIAVATTVDGTVEVIENTKNGFLFPSGDSGTLSSVLETIILKTEQEREQIKSSAHQTIHKHFSLAGMIEKTEAVYETLNFN
ncbi:MAG: glycosyltransferase [Cyclobacteriaceae bacterium]|nr:glycosyltransferase [Cyclobacteriaceae bacterium]